MRSQGGNSQQYRHHAARSRGRRRRAPY